MRGLSPNDFFTRGLALAAGADPPPRWSRGVVALAAGGLRDRVDTRRCAAATRISLVAWRRGAAGCLRLDPAMGDGERDTGVPPCCDAAPRECGGVV